MLPYVISYVIVFILFFFFSYGIIYSTDFPDLSLDFIGFGFGGYSEDKERLKRFAPSVSFPLERDQSGALDLIATHQDFTGKVLSFKGHMRPDNTGIEKFIVLLFRFIPIGVGLPLCIVSDYPIDSWLSRIAMLFVPLSLGAFSYILARRVYAKKGRPYIFKVNGPNDFASEYTASYERTCKDILSDAGIKETDYFYNSFFYFIETKYIKIIDELLPIIAERKNLYVALRAGTLPISIYFIFKFSFLILN